MSLSRKIVQNTAIQVGGKIIGTVLSLIAAGLVLRHLGDVGFGQYTTIVSFLQLFGILTDFGLYIILIKKLTGVEQGASSPMVNTIFTLRVLSGVLFLGVAPLVAWVVSWYNPAYGGEVLLGIVLTSLFYLFISMNQLLSAVFQKFLRTDWIALGELVGKTVLLVTTIVVVMSGWGLIPIMLTLVVSGGVNMLTQLIASRRYVKLRFTLRTQHVVEVLREAWPIALSIGLVLLYFKGDTVLLTFFESPQVVGWYGAPYKILEVLVTVPAMFAGLALPVITKAWQERDMVRFQKTLQKSFDALSMIALPMIVGTWMSAPQIIQVIAGDAFRNSVPILRVLIIATAAIFFGTLFGYLVVALDKQKSMVWGYGFVALSSLAGYLVLIPRYSTAGAAWVTVYSEIAIVLVAMWITLRTSRVRLRYNTFLKTLVSAIMMFPGTLVALYAVGGVSQLLTGDEFFNLRFDSFTTFSIAHLVLIIPIAAAVYVGFLFMLGAVSRSQIKEIISLKV